MIVDALPQDNAEHPFQSLMSKVTILAALTHIAFIGLFFWTGIESLAIINIASVLAYGLAYRLVSRKKLVRGFAVLTLEVFAHAIIATFILGWESGFHYYLILLLPVTAVNDNLKKQTKLILVSVEAFGYLALDLFFRYNNNYFILPAGILELLYYFNIASTLAILCFIAFCYYHLIAMAEAALVAAAHTDPLTQLSNRRCFMLAVAEEFKRFNGKVQNLTFVLCDIDHFKSVNDNYGHETGDVILKKVAQCLKMEVRGSDKLARWGGEEFIFMFPNSDKNDVSIIAERIRRKVESLSFFEKGHHFKVSLTLGVTKALPLERPEEAIARADENLYKGKHSGRNCVVVS